MYFSAGQLIRNRNADCLRLSFFFGKGALYTNINVLASGFLIFM